MSDILSSLNKQRGSVSITIFDAIPQAESIQVIPRAVKFAAKCVSICNQKREEGRALHETSSENHLF